MAAKGVERAGHAGSVLLLCNLLEDVEDDDWFVRSGSKADDINFRNSRCCYFIVISFPRKKVTFDMPFPTGCFTLLKYKNNEPVFIKLCQGI